MVPLERAIVNGRGRVQIADAYWDVSGPELPAGAAVRIVAAHGMTLEVREDNATAIALYRGRGYVETGRRPGYYDDGAAAIRLRRTLEPAIGPR